MKKYHLFERYGIELEYMIVNSNLNVLPITDKILFEKTGKYSDYDGKYIAWTNELVLHVIELKTNGVVRDLNKISDKFHYNVKQINTILKKHDAKLMPSAMHPFMNPKKDTRLWAHESNEIYEKFNEIFSCKGHGWSNLQSIHLNLPFYDDDELFRLHTAIRIILPILPAIAASSPIRDGKATGIMDSRLDSYKSNCAKIPSITGKVIPELIKSKHEYEQNILKNMYEDISEFDPDKILQYEWLNARGAIARFDRHTIEIRVLDIQECPKADFAIIEAIINLLKLFIDEKIVDRNVQSSIDVEELSIILTECIHKGENAKITDKKYLSFFGLKKNVTAKELWKHISSMIKVSKEFEFIIENGSLSTRILKHLGKDFSKKDLRSVYDKLCLCLEKNEMFE